MASCLAETAAEILVIERSNFLSCNFFSFLEPDYVSLMSDSKNRLIPLKLALSRLLYYTFLSINIFEGTFLTPSRISKLNSSELDDEALCKTEISPVVSKTTA